MIEGFIPALLLALVTTGIARHFGFFKRTPFPRPPITALHLFSIFGIYVGFLFLLSPFLYFLLLKFSTSPAAFTSLQFFIVLATLLTLLLYLRTEGKTSFQSALKNPSSPSSKFYDFGFGLLSYFVAFPWTMLSNELCDTLLSFFFHFENYEQTAVRFLKQSLVSPLPLVLALISIVIFSPIIEELLFRATLQQYLKKWISTPTAIVLTSLIFASFHFSYSQTLGNLAIIPSLFVFACFLGYVYERQGSVYASVGLHTAFNLASSLQILFS